MSIWFNGILHDRRIVVFSIFFVFFMFVSNSILADSDMSEVYSLGDDLKNIKNTSLGLKEEPMPPKNEYGNYLDDKGGFISPREYELISASKSGDIAKVKALLGYDLPEHKRTIFDVNTGSNWDEKYTPLHYAAFYGHLEIAKILIERGADVNSRDVSFFGTSQQLQTPLKRAVIGERIMCIGDAGTEKHSNMLNLIELLIESGAAIDIIDNGIPLFASAVIEAAKRHVFIERGMTSEFMLGFNKAERSARIDSLRADHPTLAPEYVLSMLVDKSREKGKSFYITMSGDKDGNNLFHHAVNYNHSQFSGYAGPINTGTDTESDLNRQIPVFSESAIVEFLVSHDFYGIDSANSEGRTPLLQAAMAGNVKAFAFLLSQGVKIDVKDKQGRSWRELSGLNVSHPEESELLKKLLKQAFENWEKNH